MITSKQMQAALSLNQQCLDGCYKEIGKLTAERDCPEEEAKTKIEENKLRIQYFKGQLEALKYVLLYSPELKEQSNDNNTIKEEQ